MHSPNSSRTVASVHNTSIVIKVYWYFLSRRFADSVSLETPVPHYDGRQWRKYGQKNINKEKHPRLLHATMIF